MRASAASMSKSRPFCAISRRASGVRARRPAFGRTKAADRRRDFLQGRAPLLALRAEDLRRSRRIGGRRRRAATADDGDDFADLRHDARSDANFAETAGDDGLNFERHLVGFDLKEVVAFLDLVADRLEPVENLAFGDGFAELGHDDGLCHRTNHS